LVSAVDQNDLPAPSSAIGRFAGRATPTDPSADGGVHLFHGTTTRVVRSTPERPGKSRTATHRPSPTDGSIGAATGHLSAQRPTASGAPIRRSGGWRKTMKTVRRVAHLVGRKTSHLALVSTGEFHSFPRPSRVPTATADTTGRPSHVAKRPISKAQPSGGLKIFQNKIRIF
jgi:hypothetical protein